MCRRRSLPSAGARKHTDDQLKEAVATARNMRQVLIALGLAPRGGNYETVWRRIDALQIDSRQLAALGSGRTLRGCSDAEITSAVRSSRSLAGVLRALGLRPGGNQGRLKTRILALGVDMSHFSRPPWNKGARFASAPASEELLVSGRWVTTDKLKRRLIAEGPKEARCEMCGRDR
jgi:hypothetical protein